jgi:arsenate reductase
MKEKLNWSFPDPSQFTGTWEEKLDQTRKVRDEIKDAVESFIKREEAFV